MSGQAGVDGSVERSLNRVACLRFLASRQHAVTVAAIAEDTGLSRPTVGAVMAELARGPVVREMEPSVRGAGRPAREYYFDPGAGHVAGIDAGPHSTRVLLADAAGNVVGSSQITVSRGVGLAQRLDDVAKCVDLAFERAGASRSSLRAVHVAVPGIISADGGIARSLALPDWVGRPVSGMLGDTLGSPVTLENDIKLAALAEHHVGSGRGVPDLAYLQIGHRISLALIINGEIRQGAHRVAGELGSLRGMRWTASSVRGHLTWSTAPSAREVFALAASGNPGAQSEIAEFCAQIAERIAVILLTLDPALVVVGGGLSRAGEAFMGPLRQAVHRLLMIPEKPVLLPSALSLDAAAIGALGLAFDQQSDRVFGIPGVPAPWDALSNTDVKCTDNRRITG